MSDYIMSITIIILQVITIIIQPITIFINRLTTSDCFCIHCKRDLIKRKQNNNNINNTSISA